MNKEKLLSHFKHSQLPLNMIQDNCLQYKDYLFSETALKPETKQKSENNDAYNNNSKINSKNNFKDSFIIENKKENVNLANNNYNNNNNAWRSKNNNTNNNIPQNTFSKGANVAVAKHNIEDSMLYDSKSANNNLNLNDTMNEDADQYRIFKDFLNNSNNKNTITPSSKNGKDNNKIDDTTQSNNINNKNNLQYRQYEQVKIDNIYLLNKKLNYNVDAPLWYVFHPIGQASFGPLSSKQLTDLYNIKIIDGSWLVRLLDIFEFKNINEFQYVKLTIINKDDWINEVNDSKLLQYTELYKISQNILNGNNKTKIVDSQFNDDITLNLDESIINTNINNKGISDLTVPFFQQQDETLNKHKNITNLNNNNNKQIINFVKDVDDQDTKWEVVNNNKGKKNKTSAKDNGKHLVGYKPKDKVETKEQSKTEMTNNNKKEEDADFVFNRLAEKHKKTEEPDYYAFGKMNDNNDFNNNETKKKKKFQDYQGKIGNFFHFLFF